MSWANAARVVETVGCHARVAEAPEVGHDHLVAGVGQRSDVPPPDAAGLRVPMEQHHRESTDTFPDVGQLEVVGHRRPVGGEGTWASGVGGRSLTAMVASLPAVCSLTSEAGRAGDAAGAPSRGDASAGEDRAPGRARPRGDRRPDRCPGCSRGRGRSWPPDRAGRAGTTTGSSRSMVSRRAPSRPATGTPAPQQRRPRSRPGSAGNAGAG